MIISLIFENCITKSIDYGNINKLHRQERGREGGLAKCLCYYISLSSKLAYGGGGESQKLTKSCLRSLWMVPIGIIIATVAVFEMNIDKNAVTIIKPVKI